MSVKKRKVQINNIRPLCLAHKNHDGPWLVLASEAFILIKSNDLSEIQFIEKEQLDADPVVLNCFLLIQKPTPKTIFV